MSVPISELYASTAAALANIIFGLLALLRAPGETLYRIFALTCFSIAMWQSSMLASYITSDAHWVPAGLAAALMTPAFLYHLVKLLASREGGRDTGIVYVVCAGAAISAHSWPLAGVLIPGPVLLLSIARVFRAIRRRPEDRLLTFTVWAMLIGATVAGLDLARLLGAPIPQVSGVGVLAGSIIFATGLLQHGRSHDIVRQMESTEAAIVSSLEEGVVLVDAGGGVVKMNEASRELVPFDNIGAAPSFAEAFEEHRKGHRGPTLFKFNGRVLEIQFSPVHSPLGSAVCVVRDVTEQFRLLERLEQNRQLAALGSMMAAVAHEIRNPLTSIKGAAQLLQSRDPALKQHVQTIVEEIDRLNRSLESFRDFVRPIHPEREAVDLASLARKTAEFVGADGVAFTIQGEGRASADPTLLRQVLVNLFKNAREAGARTVWVRVEGLRMEVLDDGPGIAPSVRERMFEPFFTTKSTGSGLGLAVSKRIIEAHGGSIRFDGSKFVIEL